MDGYSGESSPKPTAGSPIRASMPLLPARSAGQQVALPLACVERVERVEGAEPVQHALGGARRGRRLLSLAGLLTGQPAAAREHTLLWVRGPTGQTTGLLAEAAGRPLEAPALPLPPWLSERPQPFSGVALAPKAPLPLLAPERLGRLEGSPARPADGASAGAPPRAVPAAVASAGGALLVCPLGPYRLRGRPLAAGLPLSSCVAVLSHPATIPAPPGAAPCVALLVHRQEVVPVCSAAALLGLPEAAEAAEAALPSESERLVIVRLPSEGLLGLPVTGTISTMVVRHVADPALLRPLPPEALAGAIPTPRWWMALLDPARLEWLLVSTLGGRAHPAA